MTRRALASFLMLACGCGCSGPVPQDALSTLEGQWYSGFETFVIFVQRDKSRALFSPSKAQGWPYICLRAFQCDGRVCKATTGAGRQVTFDFTTDGRVLLGGPSQVVPRDYLGLPFEKGKKSAGTRALENPQEIFDDACAVNPQRL